jgi:hypothetical protein
MRYTLRYYRDEWVIFDRDEKRYMRLNDKVENYWERAIFLATELSLGVKPIKYPEKWKLL